MIYHSCQITLIESLRLESSTKRLEKIALIKWMFTATRYAASQAVIRNRF